MSRREFKLNGHTFYIRRMDPFKSLEVLAELQQSLLSPLLAGMQGKKLSMSDADSNTDSILSGIYKLSSQLGPKETLRIVRMLLDPEFVSVILNGDGEPRKLREPEVAQSMNGAADMLSLCVEIVKENYDDFLAPLAPLISKASSLMENQSGGSPKS